jgi:hypothetical protein
MVVFVTAAQFLSRVVDLGDQMCCIRPGLNARLHRGLRVMARYTVSVWVRFHFRITLSINTSGSPPITFSLTLVLFDTISSINEIIARGLDVLAHSCGLIGLLFHSEDFADDILGSSVFINPIPNVSCPFSIINPHPIFFLNFCLQD